MFFFLRRITIGSLILYMLLLSENVNSIPSKVRLTTGLSVGGVGIGGVGVGGVGVGGQGGHGGHGGHDGYSGGVDGAVEPDTGINNTCPTMIKSGSTKLFAVIIASTVVPYLAANNVSVSPLRTIYLITIASLLTYNRHNGRTNK